MTKKKALNMNVRRAEETKVNFFNPNMDQPDEEEDH
jgi:hypothetical protein